MFTGIVQGLCRIVAVDQQPSLRRLRIDLGRLAAGLELGASVAVNGTCLTVTEVEAGVARFDVIRETLERTNLGDLKTGSLVNIERSFRVGDEIGGHIVSGHISGVAELVRIDTGPNERNVFFSVPEALTRYLTLKGFVALDGASLTIARLDAGAREMAVCLIPETIARTTLGTAQVGDCINLEVDQQTQTIVDTVERLLDQPEWRARLGYKAG
ncbi:MAG: riboflavin synthase subunit alpha [Pseudomonadales bacterium]